MFVKSESQHTHTRLVCTHTHLHAHTHTGPRQSSHEGDIPSRKSLIPSSPHTPHKRMTPYSQHQLLCVRPLVACGISPLPTGRERDGLYCCVE